MLRGLRSSCGLLLLSAEALRTFFGRKLFLADRRTQGREKSKRRSRSVGEISYGMNGQLAALRGCQDFKVGREHGDGVDRS
jgi:hypothetical protein